MQRAFSDMSDMGKLYINYPMIESYQHLKSFLDSDYLKRKIPVTMRPGVTYKQLIHKESMIREKVEFPHRLDDLLEKIWNTGGTTTDDLREAPWSD